MQERCLTTGTPNQILWTNAHLDKQMNPPFKTARAQSELFTVQCEPIQNSQLIGKYKEKSTNRSISGKSQFYPGKTYDIPPLSHLTDNRVTSSLFNVVHDNKRQMDPPSIMGGDMLCTLVN